MKLLKQVLAASLVLLPVKAFAHDISEDTVKVSYALGNVAEDAQEQAEALAKADGIAGTPAGFYLNQLIDDTHYLVLHAHELALVIDADTHNDQAVEAKFAQVSLSYKRAKDGAEKVVSYLYPLKKTSEAYLLKAAYSKIQTRYVYLDGNL